MVNKKKKKVIKFKKSFNPVAGLIFLLIAGYLIFIFVQTVTKNHVSVYEVVKKDVSDNDTLRGLILRNEMLFTTTEGGYLSYFIGEGQKVGVNTTIYSVDAEGSVYEEINEKLGNVNQNSDAIEELRYDINSFIDEYNMSSYSEVYDFKYQISNTAEHLAMEAASKKLHKLIKKNKKNTDFNIVKSDRTGIISYLTDGLEGLTIKDLKSENFENMKNSWTQIRKESFVEAGDPAYKLITSDKWYIVVPISEDMYKSIGEQDSLSIVLKNDNLKIRPESTTTFMIDEDYYVEFALKNYMVHYINDRYIDIQINLNSAEGLKIPTTAIVEKDVYSIPKEFVYVDSEGNNCVDFEGLTDSKGKILTEDKKLTVELYKEVDDNYLFDAKGIKSGVVAVKKEGTGDNTSIVKRSTVTSPQKVSGVYNCNYGYCKFNMIDIAYSNPEYAIISGNNPYGLSLYDHIVLNADLLKEGDLIY
ncbi:MAG: hypothetical protein K6G11_03345 [Lachnospiraceae bacterium]|nr:hypothetical protein [Lachnospiraceae bacterium]